MLVAIDTPAAEARLSLTDFADTPLACGLPPYPKAMLVRVLADRLDLGVQKGDALLVDRDGSVAAILHNVHSIRPFVAGKPLLEVSR